MHDRGKGTHLDYPDIGRIVQLRPYLLHAWVEYCRIRSTVAIDLNRESNLPDLVYGIDPEVGRRAETAKVMPRVLEPGEQKVAVGAWCGRRRCVGRDWTTFEVALLGYLRCFQL